ncbi:MAG TPA: M55 family metallopeptidase [Gemmatimonadales bacterium]|nr:M55 family metallopeptidase [Gemmatimonadales bacterium]
MRVYISVDMEGVAGVVHEDQTNPIDPRCASEYARFRELMTAEANAAIQGAVDAGASRILVNDSHWTMRNLLTEGLHEAAELLSGGPKPRSMMEGIDGGYDAALCIGYHARAGTRAAVLDHTYTDRLIDVRLNGRSVGELGLNAALAGVFDVPVVLVSGDAALATEAHDLLGDEVATVIVKEAVGRHAARSLAPAVACRRIREAVAKALKRKGAKPFTVEAPITLEADFSKTVEADMAELVPGSIRTSGRTVAFTHHDYKEVFRAWRAMHNLAAVGG